MKHAMDTEVRKQLLLTRIALERAQWTREVDDLRQAAHPQRLVSEALGVGWLARLFTGGLAAGQGLSSATGLIGRLARGWVMLRRQPVLWPLVAGAWSWTRRRGVVTRRSSVRVALISAIGVGLAAAGWWVAKRSATPPPP